MAEKNVEAKRFELALHRHMIAFAIAVAAVAAMVFLSLKLSTDAMGRRAAEAQTAARAANSAESARAHLATFSQVSNLRPARGGEVRDAYQLELMAGVQSDLEAVRRTVEPAEVPAVDKAARDVTAFFGSREGASPGFDVAFASLSDIVRVESAREAASASRLHFWDVVADQLGWILAVGMLLILFAVYRAIFRPLVGLVGAMKRFGAGDRAARADANVGVDLATVAATFNEMADIITVQHTRMLDFLASVSRELKNPVQVMRMALQQFGNGNPLPSEDKIRARHALLWREIERIDRLVDSFLDASRIEWDRLDLQQGRQDARDVVTEVVRTYETFSTVHQISLSVPDQPVWVSFDPGRMAQVVHTLMSNAIQFSPRGGIVDVTLVEDPKKRERQAILSITDHGAGIGGEEMAKLFEPFHVVTGPRKVSPGTSVALSVARRIVEAHGGHMDVESKSGEGATFRVYLPLAFEPTKGEMTSPGIARAAPAEAPAAPSNGG